ncbi:hypothetical protein [Anaerosalibacter sp. Marseille-P3206]|uniref:hypothetical protein n=1 Tax=Anaerosalibacter sp. Marseille-P3206 TaxID=1871005 RepID=UPI0013566C61|nr:hypothetical protein [Anaerosalibacter sp. Marseille-P3206]
MNAPCKDCKQRRLYCHSQCEKYKNWKYNYKTSDREENVYTDYVVGAVQRMKGVGRWG